MSAVNEDGVGVDEAVDGEEDEEVDEEAVARFWGAPRFATASYYSGFGGDYDDEDATVDSKDDGDYDEDEEEEYLFEYRVESVKFPESTHTLFFMFPVCSLPFAFATGIATLSFGILNMALLNSLESNSSPGNPLGVPANVAPSVKTAQFLGILTAILMEEEIPTGLQLLRVIPRPSFKAKFPKKHYTLFFFSAMIRLSLGLLFLVNAFIILIQSTSVLDIFFNVLALQFISSLDDIAFKLAKMDVMGGALRRACTARLYKEEFEKESFRRSRIENTFIRCAYLVELALFFAGLTIVTLQQNRGYYSCLEVTVDFGDGIWADPLVNIDGEFLPGYTLVFSYFNGVYKQLNKEIAFGRPVYTEMKKFDGTEFEDTSFNEGETVIGGGITNVVPAKIKYSKDAGRWIVTHPFIKQQKGADDDLETWMLRSPETDDFELQTVEGEWERWCGRIESTRVKVSCNTCYEDTQCNLNGVCGKFEEGHCHCNDFGNTKYLGTFCEIELEEKCETIVTEDGLVTYGVNNIPPELFQNGKYPNGILFQEYNRPLYTHISGDPNVKVGDLQWLSYTGSRWFEGGSMLSENVTLSFEDAVLQTENFHAFWSNAYSGSTKYVSDPTTRDTPVGVDFYVKGEVNNETTNQFGPFGALTPLQKGGQVGRGIWRCAGPRNSRNTTEIQDIFD